MPANRSLALVVRTVDVFETSLVVTLFTRELGKVAALAKGGRRLKSPFQGGLDLLGVSDIVLLPKASESLDLLTESAPVERFPCLRRDLAALYAGYYIAELLTDLTDYHDPHPKLFDAARITLRHLGEAGLRARRVLRFELACLREIGLMPLLDRCAHCGEPLDPEVESVAFGPATGGALCPACRPGQPHVMTTSRRTIESMRALASPGNEWREREMGGSELAAVRQTVGAVVSHVLGHRPRVWPFLGV
ncbi:DNA repair protein RecO [Paludisphaera mucosa]|uniref:DNA repair protein RecO n=1 Tax=Paludisphaera mucosa TaxID=3030827 RepID=A0ABT6FG62_9BACT|nr:DNA repair protein RecO [Paludisphaera mucosa]MDG3006562.1 DNA repair protein RecO [Paludisphaera mucosa]